MPPELVSSLFAMFKEFRTDIKRQRIRRQLKEQMRDPFAYIFMTAEELARQDEEREKELERKRMEEQNKNKLLATFEKCFAQMEEMKVVEVIDAAEERQRKMRKFLSCDNYISRFVNSSPEPRKLDEATGDINSADAGWATMQMYNVDERKK